MSYRPASRGKGIIKPHVDPRLAEDPSPDGLEPETPKALKFGSSKP